MADQLPSVGEVLDGYRFKGGDPKQESSWEQVEPIDVSAQYGPGARQLPNGVIERVGPRGGVSRIGSANGSAGGSQSSALVGADARARFMINLGPLQAAQGNLEEMDAGGYNPSSLRNTVAAGLEAIPFDGGFAARAAGGGDYNAYTQAGKTFEAAIMPIMSGAAVTPSEAQRLIRAALPQPGDTPAVLAQKSEQRRMMINAVAEGIGQAAPYEIEQAAAALDAGAGTPEQEKDTDQNPAAVAPVDISGMSATDLLALTPGTAIRLPDGTVTRLTGAPSVGARGNEVSPGVFTQESPDDAQDRYREEVTGADRQAAGFMRGVVDTATFGMSDEIGAAIDTVLPPMAGQRSGWVDGFGPAYRQNVSNYRAFADADEEDVGGARIAGQVTGGFVPGLGVARAATGGTRLARAGRGAAAGAGYGGAYGFGSGEGNALERLPSAGAGAAFGAAGGAASPFVANALSRAAAPVAEGVASLSRVAARPFVNALGDAAPSAIREAVQPNPLASGVRRFADRSPQDVNALNTNAARFRAEEIAPVFADVVNDGGRGTMRALATRQTPARQSARDFAEGRVEALPSRLSRQARRIVSDDARPVDEIVGELETGRANQARTQYAEPYAQPVQIDAVTAQALSGAPGRAAIQRARAAAEAFNDSTAMQELDALASGQTQQVSAGTLDRIRQAMSGRAEKLAQNPATRAVGAGVGQRAGQVDQALENVEGLGPAREAYRGASRQIDAARMGERFMGNANPDDFTGAMQGLTPEQLAPARAASARSIEIAARNPGAAPGVARRLYADPETANMGRAVMGEDMGRLSQAARAEADAVRNGIEINPRAGSPTNLNQQDTLGAAGAVLGVARDATNPIALAGRAISAIKNRGFNDAEAEALVQAAIDPVQTDRLIGMLSERMSRREARNLARAIRYQLTTGPQSGQQR